MTQNKNEANKRLIEKMNDLEKDYGQTFSNTQKVEQPYTRCLCFAMNISFRDLNQNLFSLLFHQSIKIY